LPHDWVALKNLQTPNPLVPLLDIEKIIGRGVYEESGGGNEGSYELDFGYLV